MGPFYTIKNRLIFRNLQIVSVNRELSAGNCFVYWVTTAPGRYWFRLSLRPHLLRWIIQGHSLLLSALCESCGRPMQVNALDPVQKVTMYKIMKKLLPAFYWLEALLQCSKEHTTDIYAQPDASRPCTISLESIVIIMHHSKLISFKNSPTLSTY